MENISVEVPEEIQEEILSWMPLKSLMKFMCVSKKWASIICKKKFEDLYYARSETRPRVLFASCRLFDNPNREIVFHSVDQEKKLLSRQEPMRFRVPAIDEPLNEISAPVRGLVRLQSVMKVVICNPGTRKFRTLPEIGEFKWLKSFLGYDEDTRVYKVFCIASNGSGKYQAFTIGLGEESWRPILCKHDDYFPMTNGVWKREVLYYGAWCCSSQDSILIGFNVRSEELNVIDFPKQVAGFGVYAIFVNYNGNVAFVKDSSVMENKEIKMLVRNEVSGQWLEDRIEIPPLKELSGVVKYCFQGFIGTGELVFGQTGVMVNHDGPLSVLYDNATGKHKGFKIDGNRCLFMAARTFYNHVESLSLP